jgi:hypothetical protein
MDLCQNNFPISSGISLPVWDAKVLSFLPPRHKNTKFYGEKPIFLWLRAFVVSLPGIQKAQKRIYLQLLYDTMLNAA